MQDGYLFDIPEAESLPSQRRDQSIWVTGAELAEYLCVSEPAVTKMKNTGFLATNSKGKYDLKSSVRAYIQKKVRAMTRRTERQQEEDLDRIEQLWDIENKKSKNRSWREQYASDLIGVVLRTLYASAKNFSNELDPTSREAELIRQILGQLSELDAHDVCYQVEGQADGLD